MLLAAIVIAMIARSLNREDQAVLVVPEEVAATKSEGDPVAKMQLDVVTIPPGATVHLGSTAIGPTPVAVVVEPGQRMLVTLEGHQAQYVDLTGSEARTITLTLAKTATVQ
jgi:hypothetical protein